MPSHDETEEDIQKLLLDKLNSLPSAGLLYLLIAGSSGVFGGAWWLGIDSRPDPWTGTEARAANAHLESKIDQLRGSVRNLEAESVIYGRQINNHAQVQEHEGANRRLKSLTKRVDEIHGKIFEHTSGSSGRINRLKNLEDRMNKLEDSDQ